ncbi:MAG TPA: PH domain-containing protein [Candidatus Ruania gallistercoris]|uniref:PH domain-containing protein n=1 Tax=Candidatus Ruania gallistercoris TaxID=2838746 RepID=A0A9D2EG11_9MICO|nr:PH domain-containing protein [Candidatus Ruania gallistercoris]
MASAGTDPEDRSSGSGPGDRYAPFRSRATRIVTIVLIVWIVAGWVLFVVLTNRLDEPRREYQVGSAVLALLICVFLHLVGSVAAYPSPAGLRVRNIIGTARLDWAQIVSVRFGERDWVQLDLADGRVLPVLAIQRVDGERARAASRRLATLVAEHEPGGVDSGSSGG